MKLTAPAQYNQAMQKPLIVVTGSPDWWPEVQRAAGVLGLDIVRYGERGRYVSRLAQDHAALVLVDGMDADWRDWVTTPKVRPATRRIPVILVAGGDGLEEAGRLAGADAVYPPGTLAAWLPEIVSERARLQRQGDFETLAEACGEPLPPEAREAIRLFNEGEYYHQHDLLEALWMAEPGPVRDLYQGVLQVGVAYFQVRRGNRRGAHKMLLRSLQWLNPLPDVCQGVDVARLRGDANRLREALEALPEGAPLEPLYPLLGQVHLVE